MKTPIVSVILPVFNASNFLFEAIKSILTQTLSEFELIIIDDGSTDNSVNIIKCFSDERIKLFLNSENKGIVFTLNRAISLTTTNLIARMDADDIALPERLHSQFEFMQSHPNVALVCGWIQFINAEGKIGSIQKRFDNALYFDTTYECTIPHPTVMFKKSAINELGGYRNCIAEDYDLWSRMIQKYKMVNLEKVVLYYRIHDENLSNQLKAENLTSTRTIVKNNLLRITKLENIDNHVISLLCNDFSINNKYFLTYLNTLLILKKIKKGLLAIPNPNKSEINIKKAYKLKLILLFDSFLNHLAIHQKIAIYLIFGVNKYPLKRLIKNVFLS